MFILTPDFDSCNLFCELKAFLGKGYKRFNDAKCVVYSLCSYSGAGIAFKTKESFLAQTGAPEKVGSTVWDFLVQKGYLEENKKGWTIFPYLKENDWISKESEGNPLYADSSKEEIRPYVFLGKIGYKTVLKKYNGDEERVNEALDALSEWKAEKIERGELREDFNDILALRSFIYNRIMKK